MLSFSQLQALYTAREAEFLSAWKELLRIPSVSADTSQHGACRVCAEWLKQHLTGIGFAAQLIETERLPLIFAEHRGPAGSPTILFYGHYDVQPAERADGWDSDPFEPELRSGRMYARGAQDNKGQVAYVLAALRVLTETQSLPCTVRVLLEGEEESGSVGLAGAIPKLVDKLKSDVLMVCDTGMPQYRKPSITAGLRGIVALRVTVGGLHSDLHSGHFGGVVKNPALELARILATLHNADGSIGIEGFIDGAPALERARSAEEQPGSDAATVSALTGAPPNGGEAGLPVSARRGLRPTIEINGIHGGYAGPGGKTIIPKEAFALLTARLVGKQDPARCLELVKNHLRARTPAGLTLTITEDRVGGPALLADPDSASMQVARTVLKDLSADGSVLVSYDGGSIPIVAELVQVSGAEPLLVGFGLDEDRIHGANESFGLNQFQDGFLYASRILQELATSYLK